MLDPIFGVVELQAVSWIVAIGIIMAFNLAMAMGSNDLSNSFATSVGSKVLTLTQAVIIAAIFDLSGAMLLGGGVTDTMRKGVVEVSIFDNTPALLMLGMLCALFGAFAWVAFATALTLPVSTTHAVVGAIIGFSLCQSPSEGVDWFGVGKICLSWIVSPVFAGVLTAILYLTTRHFILRVDPEVGLKRVHVYASMIIGTVFFLVSIFAFNKKKKDGDWVWIGPLISIGIGFVVFLIAEFLFVPYLFKRLQNEELDLGDEADCVEKDLEKDVSVTPKETEVDAKPKKKAVRLEDREDGFTHTEKTGKLHSNTEIFDSFVERRFAAIQVLTACYAAFAHGSNDLSNVAAPLSSIFSIYDTNVVEDEVEMSYVAMTIGGVGIVVGLAIWGRKVIETVGHKMTKITPSRGVAVELGVATAVLLASYLKMPVSTTHCCVGSIVAVGLCNKQGKNAVNWSLFSGIFISWVVTLPAAGLVSAGFYALLKPVVENSLAGY
eukprot:Nk52_evm19s1400 gene=Nk52_evmTU19s1400